MITNALITGSLTAPTAIFIASVSGEPVDGTNPKQDSAITSMILCNLTANFVIINMFLVKSGDTPDTVTYNNMVVNTLEVPPNETVFFSDDRIVLDGGDGIYVGTDSASDVSATVSTLAI